MSKIYRIQVTNCILLEGLICLIAQLSSLYKTLIQENITWDNFYNHLCPDRIGTSNDDNSIKLSSLV